MNNGIAENEYIGLVVGESTKALVVLLSSRVEKLEGTGTAVNMDCGSEGVEYGRDIVGWEFVLGIRVDHAGLTDGSIADEDGFDAD